MSKKNKQYPSEYEKGVHVGDSPSQFKFQWEKNVDLTPKGSNNPADAFNPRPGKERPCTHTRVNECDH